MDDTEYIRCGRYELRSRIGSGAMSEVWRARHLARGNDAAVKILGSDGFESRRRRRFQREISSHAGLHHPHIVDVFGTGETDSATERTSGGAIRAGRLYLAMELSEIGSLRNYLPVPSWRDFRLLLEQLLGALAHAHARHIVHRDLKPGNILVFTSEDEAAHMKVSDFGMAHATSREYDRGTDQVLMPSGGTPVYMAPEQLRARWRDFGPWTDLYTLGILAYEIACGRPPYLGDSFLELAEQHLSSDPLLLDPAVAVPDGFGDWIRTMTAANPADRFRTAADAARSLETLEAPDHSDGYGTHSGRRADGTSSTLDARPPPGTSTPLRSSVPAHTEFGRDDGRLDLDPDRAPTDLEGAPPRQMPDDWRRRQVATPRNPRAVDLDLCHLVEPALTGREPERDVLWRNAVEVFESGQPRAVVLRGPTGTGKTRLATWLVRRLRESGLFRSLETLHPREGAPLDGLRRLIERRFRTWNLERSRLHEHLRRALERQLGLPRPLLRERSNLLRGITEFLRPTPAGAGPDELDYYFGSRTEQHALVHRLLALIGHDRPVVVRIDDLPGSTATVEWIARGLEQGELPVLWVLTSDRDTRRLSDELVDAPATETVELGPLPPSDQRRLVESILPVDAPLGERIRARTEGRPLFAIHLLRDWAQAGLLEPLPEGFALSDPGRARIPQNLAELWRYRVEALLAELPRAERFPARIALEAAAAMGRSVRFEDWTEVVDRLGVEVTDHLTRTLSRLGLFVLVHSGWQFAHRTLVRTLREKSRRSGRWGRIQAALARWMDEKTDRHTKRSAERVARRWIAAGETARAVERLEDAIDLARVHRDHVRMQRLLELHGDQLDRLPAGRATSHRLYSAVQHIPLELLRDNADDAERWFRRGLELAEPETHPLEYAHLLRAASLIDRHRGDVETALGLLQKALERFRELSDDLGRAETHLERGINFALMGPSGRAIEELDRAASYYLAAGDQLRALRARVWQGTVFVYADDFDRAERLAEGLLERADRLGAPSAAIDAHNLLGEVERFRGAPEAAREHYRRAIREGTKIGVVSPSYRFNLAAARIAAGAEEAALETLAALEAEQSDVIGGRHEIYFALIRAAAAAARGRWGDWDDHVAKASEAADWLVHRSAIERDPPWLARLAARITRDSGAAERAHRLDRLADRLRDWFEGR